MYARDWLQAHQAGKVVHEWFELALTDRGRECRLKVSADAPRVLMPGGDCDRHAAGAYACDQLAQVFAGFMLTAKLVELRHAASSVVLSPLVASLIKKGGSIRNTTDVEHSRAIDKAIQGAATWVGPGAARAQAKEGPWCVSNTGKHMILDAKCTTEKCVNHGWLVHRTEVIWLEGKAYWLGTPVSVAAWLPEHFVIQHRGNAHGFGPDGEEQDDYSQFPLIAAGTCWIDGQPGVPTELLYTTENLCGFVTHDGVPLKSARHPAVPLVVWGGEVVPDTDRSPSSDTTWINPEWSHGRRCVDWMLAQMTRGVREQPNGSNKGPEICEWLERCVRDGVDGFGKSLARMGANWCAASACAADIETRIEHDPPAPYLARAAGIELENDAKARGAWRPAALAADGLFELEIGDLVILPRGKPGSWERHVCRFVAWVDRAKGLIETIGGNEENRFMRTTRHVLDALGYIEMPDPVRPPVQVLLDAAEVEAMPRLLAQAHAADLLWDGNNVLGGDIFPSDLAA